MSSSTANFVATVGLEVHVQLNTDTKMFCSCATSFGQRPNTNICPVCVGYPGAMPVLNERAVMTTVKIGHMLGSHISRYSKWDRKNYFYPDMPKNYQITQFDKPICEGGSVRVDVDGGTRDIGITRVHLEEDVGKNIHSGGGSGIDFNRAGVPLAEIVSEPDMRSADDALAYLLTLKQILLYAGVSNCNLEEGNMRCDVNCSVAAADADELGMKTEIKNLNTFKGVHQALQYEIKRQLAEVGRGGAIVQETRRWDVDAGVTLSMRTKEDAHDYRYFPEPDLMPVALSEEQIEQCRAELPELPSLRRERFASDYGLSEYDAKVLVADRAVADYYEAVAALSENPKAVANWVMTEMMRLLAEHETSIDQAKVTPAALAGLVRLVDGKTINSTSAKQVFEQLFREGGDPEAIVKAGNMAQVSDTSAIDAFVEKAMADNPKSVDDYRAGKGAALKFLVGQVMRQSKGKANPQLATERLEAKLGSAAE